MEKYDINLFDASFFSCSDYSIAKYLDNKFDEKILEFSNERIANIIVHCKNIMNILPLFKNRISGILNNMDIYYLKKVIKKNREYFDYLSNENKKLLIKILKYGNDKVGYYVSSKNIFDGDLDINDVLSLIDDKSNIIYVVEKNNKYIGVCYIADLIGKTGSIKDYVKKNYPYVDANEHTSDFLRYNHHYFLNSYPVLEDEKLVGIISNKGLNDFLKKEADDDYYKLAGIIDNRLKSDNEHLGRKLPWLFVSLISFFAIMMAFDPFKDMFSKIPALGIYLCMILMIVVSSSCMSLGSSLSFIKNYRISTIKGSILVYKEIKKSIIIGLVLSIIVFVVLYFYLLISQTNYLDSNFYSSDALIFSGVMSLIIFTSCIISNIIAFATPIIIERLGYDYSIASIQIITTFSYVVTLVMYVGFVNLFFI